MSRAADPFWEHVRALFHASVAASPEERKRLLDECGESGVRDEVASLLEQHDLSASFLEKPVWDLGERAHGPGMLVGAYRLVRSLGDGGMGTVFLAERSDDQFAQRVAVKFVRGGVAGPQMLRRFRQERQILAALEHPNVARLLDGGATADGLPYLVMEYIEGTPIDVYCREHALSVEERLRLFLQLCDGVEHAHRSLVIHRDIKPANVLVTASGVPKLLDFGIAKLTTEEAEGGATVTRLMTPDYASPEQLLGKPVTTATDVYSLGVLLYELLTGVRPFAGRERTAATEASKPSSVAHERRLRGDLDRILAKALEPERERRYGSVEKFADDVRRHLAGHPVEARGATFGYLAAKFVRRNKLAAAFAAAIMIVIAVAFAAVVHQKRIAEQRFDKVRLLAHSVVFELHDAIARLPGSTAARRLIVDRALVYLNGLAAEASDNVPLQMELAGAYERVGDVQGLPYRPNLGDTSGALRSYAKGLAIAEEIRRTQPDDERVLAMIADLHDRAGLVEQRQIQFRAAYLHHTTALAIREHLEHRGIDGDLALARTWVAIGDCIFLSRDLAPVKSGNLAPNAAHEKALAILARIPQQGPHRRALLIEIARAHQRLGGYYTGGGKWNPQLALAHHEASLRALEELAALDPADALAKRNLADARVMKATLQSAMGDGRGALDGVARALPVLQALADADPQNVEAQHDLAFAYEQVGEANGKLGRWDEAERGFEKAIDIRARLTQSDPLNREDRRGIGGLYTALRSLSNARGDKARAAEYGQKATAILEELRH